MTEEKDFLKDKPLKFYIKHLEETAEKNENTEEALLVVRDIITNLIKANRLFDISSLYVFLKSAALNGYKTGIFYEHAKETLKKNINDLFTKSITYNNTELREMFSDILGNDTGLLMELVSFIFRKYNLFGMKLSDNINKQLIQVAEKDLCSFIEHADSRFLAFYLSSLPKLSFVPKEHIEQLTKMILFLFDSEKYTAKILEAMNQHPTADILLLFLLSERENDRLKALQILRNKLSAAYSEELRTSFAKKAPYFIKTALNGGLFYDFHNIPLIHKELFASILKYTDVKIIRDTVIPLLRTENNDSDLRITESKLAFVPAFRDFIPAFPDLVPELTKILRDEKIEIEVKEEIRKVLIESK
ncbi:hypothetical protein J5681_02830 [bacterium]|nr:hypothetical protein [bacterium]